MEEYEQAQLIFFRWGTSVGVGGVEITWAVDDQKEIVWQARDYFPDNPDAIFQRILSERQQQGWQIILEEKQHQPYFSNTTMLHLQRRLTADKDNA